MTQPPADKEVWDLPTRLFHWCLVALIATSWLTGEYGLLDIHKLSGIAILVLVTFRLAWGFVGGRHARFADFVRGPRAAMAYLRDLFDRKAHALRPPGHNPVGGWMVLLLLLLILVQGTTGLFARDEILFQGPLAHLVSDAWIDRLTKLHLLNFQLLKWAIILHIAASLLYLLVLRDNLITPMVTGWPVGRRGGRSAAGGIWRALLVLAGAAALVLGLIAVL